MNTVFDEEYCGVHGVSIERAWPLTKGGELIPEVSQRLMQSIVFILRPPTLLGVNARAYKGRRDIPMAYYKFDDDGYSQSYGESITTGQSCLSDHVVEIKTSYIFQSTDYLAILVPFHLLELAKKYFPAELIVAVGPTSYYLKKLPQICDILYCEALPKPINTQVPDFRGAMTQFIQEKRIHHFSLHAVRLHTLYDFVPRFIANLEESSSLLTSCNAKIINIDNEKGWILVHKKFTVPREKMFMELIKRFKSPPEMLYSMQIGMQPLEEKYQQLTTAKGDWIMYLLPPNMMSSLSAKLALFNIEVLLFNNQCMVSLPSKQKEWFDKLSKTQLEKPAQTIQAAARAYLSRRSFLLWKTTEEQTIAAQEAIITLAKQRKFEKVSKKAIKAEELQSLQANIVEQMREKGFYRPGFPH